MPYKKSLEKTLKAFLLIHFNELATDFVIASFFLIQFIGVKC